MGFPQDAIISAIKVGDVDVGIVRSGLLELLASEGSIDISSFSVVQNNKQIDYPHMISSQLYPEWPFASLQATNKKLREDVLIALMATQDPNISQKYNLRDLWSAPLSYGEARKLVKAYENRASGTKDTKSFLNQTLISAMLLALLALASLTAYLQLMGRRRKLNVSQVQFFESDSAKQAAEKVQLRFSKLTKRECEILCLICNGSSSKLIADELGISIKTVEFHRANLLQKTAAGTTPQLVQIATRLGFDVGKITKH